MIILYGLCDGRYEDKEGVKKGEGEELSVKNWKNRCSNKEEILYILRKDID